jgi:hypothetical protein
MERPRGRIKRRFSLQPVRRHCSLIRHRTGKAGGEWVPEEDDCEGEREERIGRSAALGEGTDEASALERFWVALHWGGGEISGRDGTGRGAARPDNPGNSVESQRGDPPIPRRRR